MTTLLTNSDVLNHFNAINKFIVALNTSADGTSPLQVLTIILSLFFMCVILVGLWIILLIFIDSINWLITYLVKRPIKLLPEISAPIIVGFIIFLGTYWYFPLIKSLSFEQLNEKSYGICQSDSIDISQDQLAIQLNKLPIILKNQFIEVIENHKSSDIPLSQSIFNKACFLRKTLERDALLSDHNQDN